jgi:hypothetical protein
MRRGTHAVLASALAADKIAFGKWQEHAIDSRVVFGAAQELGLEAGDCRRLLAPARKTRVPIVSSYLSQNLTPSPAPFISVFASFISL